MNAFSTMDLEGEWNFLPSLHPMSLEQVKGTQSSDWIKIKAPGNWPRNSDGEFYQYGHYHKTIELSQDMVGADLVLSVNTYISGLKIYIDGKLYYERSNKNPIINYYPFAEVPVVFNSTQKTIDIDIQVNTILMRGIYQEVFDIKKVSELGPSYKLLQFFSGEFRVLSSHLNLFFGLFFFLIYLRSKKKIYLSSFSVVLSAYLYFGMSNTYYYRFFNLNDILLFHYLGVIFQSLSFNLIAQSFYKKYVKINKLIIVISALLSLLLFYLILNFDHTLFMYTRKYLFLFSFLVALPVPYFLYKGCSRAQIKAMFLSSIFYLFCSLHDMLLALGFFNSIQLFSLGCFVFTLSVIYFTILQFTEMIKRQNVLLSKLSEVNAFLDEKIETRAKAIKMDLDSNLEMAKLAGMNEISSRVLHEIGNEITPMIVTISSLKNYLHASPQVLGAVISKAKQTKEKDEQFYNIFLKTLEKVNDQMLQNDAEMGEKLEHFELNLQKLSDIVSSQQEYAIGSMPSENYNIGVLINDAVEVCNSKYDLTDIDITIKGDIGCSIHGTRFKFIYILSNLIANSIEEYAKDESHDVKKIDIKVKKQGNETLLISIDDFAGGFKKSDNISDINSLFNKGTTTKKNKLGFGLHVINNMLTQMNSRIEIKNHEGIGFSVKILLKIDN